MKDFVQEEIMVYVIQNVFNILIIMIRKINYITQSLWELLEYLVYTYSNENETVLDFTMGSGDTGV